MRTLSEPAPPSGRAGLSLLLTLGIALAGLGLSGIYVDYRWFSSLGHDEVYRTVLLGRWGTGIAAALFLAFGVFVNVRLARHWAGGHPPLFLHDQDGVPRVNLAQWARRATWPAIGLLGLLSGLANSAQWTEVALYFHGSSFGSQDPLFGKDISFYFFTLPVLESGLSLFNWTTVMSAAGAIAIYFTHGALQLSERSLAINARARAHLLVLGAVFLMSGALDQLLEIYGLLYSELGPMTGASYADVHAKLPALRISAGLSAVGAGLLLISIRSRSSVSVILLALALQLVGTVSVRVFPAIVHRFSVIPNELEKERPYLADNIAATRAAYALDGVVERDLSANHELTAQDIANNRATIDNIRLWDHRPLLDTFAQIQEIRTYYDFTSVDNDRYLIDGKLRQVMLSPRELAAESLPSRTWVNERFTFTHGYGLTLGPVNEATQEGLPVLFVQDIPPVSKFPAVEVSRPQIYFGELSNDHVFVRTHNREFDYPSGEGYVQTDYEGKDGIRFDSTLMRLSLAAQLRSLKVLLSNDIDSDSRVLLHRNITDRIHRIVPFAVLDPDPYLIVREDGTLLWVCDAYLTSHRYPYAEPIPGSRINYIRNSIKVTVDAYDGTVTVYAIDPQDPLLAAYRRLLPNTFTALADMPADVRAHLRYPAQIFAIQANMLATYHMREAQLLYNREDQWEIPAVSTGEGSTQLMEPYYTVMRLPGGSKPEFILMLPFTPKRKDNLSAWMVARSDGEHLGELMVYRFPKDRLVFGPQQIVNRINQDAEISGQISLWDQRGSDALFGTLLVIPVEESLLYVRPLYLRSEGGKIPELKRVIVAYEKRIAMEPSLEKALSVLFQDDGRQTGLRSDGTSADLRRRSRGATPETATTDSGNRSSAPSAGPVPTAPAAAALYHFERALSAQRGGDWATYGEQLKAVERYLRDMQPAPQPIVPAPVDAGVPEGE